MKIPEMTKETFVGIIKAIQDQKEREDKFTKAITQAFVDAGDLEEFHTSDNFYPPTNLFIDSILESLSYSFISEHQTQEQALDKINYFMYELSLMNYTFWEPNSPDNKFEVHPVPAYYESSGVRIPLSTPGELYDALVYEMDDQEPDKHKVVKPGEIDLIESVLNDDKDSNSKQSADIWDSIRQTAKEFLGIDCPRQTDYVFREEHDSFDMIQFILALGQEFNIDVSDDELDKYITKNITYNDLIEFVRRKPGR